MIFWLIVYLLVFYLLTIWALVEDWDIFGIESALIRRGLLVFFIPAYIVTIPPLLMYEAAFVDERRPWRELKAIPSEFMEVWRGE